MPPLVSPRRHSLDAWREKSHALLKAPDKISNISGVLISLLVLHGSAKFDALFSGTNAVEFARQLDPQRDKMFSAPKRIPTGTALSCLRAALDFKQMFSKYKNSANKRDFLIKQLQDSMAWDDITKFRILDNTAIEKIVDLICTMDNWTLPRHLLLGENMEKGNNKSFKRELDLMAEMYECEPTTEEENLQVVESMVENAQLAGNWFMDVGAKLLRMVWKPPYQAAEPENEWEKILIPWGAWLVFWWVWLYGMSCVCITWFDALRVEFPKNDVERDEVYLAPLVLLEWDAWALMLFFVFSRWYRWCSNSMVFLFVGLLSLQVANSLTELRIIHHAVYPQTVLCWNNYMQYESNETMEICRGNDTEMKLYMCSYCYYYIVCVILATNLVDIAMSVVVIVHNNKDLDMKEKDRMFHFPYCFATGVLYGLTNRLLGNVPIVLHTLNTVVFLLFGAWTCSRSNSHNHASGTFSLRVSRFICLFVCVTDWCVCKLTGVITNASVSIVTDLELLATLHQNMFWFFLADCILSKLCAKKR